MNRTTNSLRSLLVAFGLVVALAGCGASGGDDSSSPSTTATPAEGSTTTAADSPDTTEDDSGDSGDSGSSDLTVDDLEDILPEASDLGDDWEADESDDSGDDDAEEDDEPDAGDQAIEEQCPEFAGLAEDLDDTSDDSDEASRSFTDAADRTIEVSLKLDAEDELAELDAAVDAIDGCTVTYEEEGTTTTMAFTAESDGSRGDQGLTVTAQLKIEDEMLQEPLELGLSMRMFSIDGIGVMIAATDGLSDEDMAVVPNDDELLGDVADLMENRINDLVEG